MNWPLRCVSAARQQSTPVCERPWIRISWPNAEKNDHRHPLGRPRTPHLHRAHRPPLRPGAGRLAANPHDYDREHRLDLFYGAPSADNAAANRLYRQNRFSVTRQLHYSRDNAQLALDLCLFINGLPVATFELKNSLTKQTAADAVEQYKRDRNPNEPLFRLGRCLAHFASDHRPLPFRLPSRRL
ncbi:MAG: hypothetical protein F4X14_00585 [Caldilineaceae bacterium SB0661_bin_32]|uniref:type I site-specific deoxyribonuclease n=1 Tax=Caldilineaceae bacterium SB0661_bin_32 TaxID=2605255 RepID=A0A6B1D0V1_9CHLR|nr:hypothetical protein [Caldilineaceae bacterium SB0661_bin_32]